MSLLALSVWDWGLSRLLLLFLLLILLLGAEILMWKFDTGVDRFCGGCQGQGQGYGQGVRRVFIHVGSRMGGRGEVC